MIRMMAELPLRKQGKLCANAEIVVSTQGAGLRPHDLQSWAKLATAILESEMRPKPPETSGADTRDPVRGDALTTLGRRKSGQFDVAMALGPHLQDLMHVRAVSDLLLENSQYARAEAYYGEVLELA